MKAYVRIGIAAKLMDVCPQTIRRGNKDGKITCVRTVGVHRRIALIEIKRILRGEEADERLKTMAIYARVSSHEQKKKGDLARQVEAATG